MDNKTFSDCQRVNDTCIGNGTGTSTDVIPKPVRIIVILIVSVTVILTNVLNLIVLRKTRQIPRIAKICVLNLSIADLASGIVCMLPCIVCAITGTWPYGIVWCQIAGIFHGTCCAVSIWSLSMVSVDRYLVIKFPLRYHNLMTTRRCVTALLSLWCLGFGTFLVPLFISGDWIYYQFDPASVMCGLYWRFKWFCILTGVCIPVTSGFILLYTSVAVIKETSLRVGPADGERNDKIIHIKAIKVPSAAVIVFFSAWGPYVGSVFASSFAIDVHIPPGVQFSLLWLANSNSFLNVFIYSMVYKSFRIRTKRIVRSVVFCGLLKFQTREQSETRDS